LVVDALGFEVIKAHVAAFKCGWSKLASCQSACCLWMVWHELARQRLGDSRKGLIVNRRAPANTGRFF
jgi:hypothetical protein